MSIEVPEAIRVACRHWGSQKRRIWSGGDWYMAKSRKGEPERRSHVDGYAESLLGRMRDERINMKPSRRVPGETRSRRLTQAWDEVFWGDGLTVQQALQGLPEEAYNVLHLHYVWDPYFNLNATQKAALIALKTRAYWEALGRGEYWVWARIDSGAGCAHENAKVISDLVEKIVARTLTASKHHATKAQSGESVPSDTADLNLAALNRSKLSVAR